MEIQTDKSKKKFYKQWWLWVLAVIVFFWVVGSMGNKPQPISQPTTPAVTQEIVPAKTVPTVVKKQAPTPAPVVVQTPPTPAPVSTASWHTVTTFSGTGDTNTNDFVIQGSKWRIDWGFAFPESTASFCEQNGCNLTVFVYKNDGSSTDVDDFLQQGQQPQTGTVYEYNKTGDMYFHVVSGNVSWNLTVEDYY